MQRAVLFIFVWFLLFAEILVYGRAPSSKEGWFALIAIGPVLYVLGATVIGGGVDRLYSIGLVRAIERHPSKLIRIGGLILFFLATSAAFLCIFWAGLWLYYHHGA